MDVSREIDTLLPDRAVIFGSLPPEGRDLDLLVQGSRLPSIRDALRKRGFVAHRDSWARFRNCSADVVELVDPTGWGLPSSEIARLFQDSTTLPGHQQLAQPSSVDALLILARRYGRGMQLDTKKLARIEEIVTRDPDAWEAATRLAPAWTVEASLAALREAVRGGRVEAQISRPKLTSVRRKVGKLRKRRRPVIVSFSGLDGCGKSTQAEALQTTLSQLGITSHVSWAKLSRDPLARQIATPIRRAMSRIISVPEPAEVEEDPEEAFRNYPDGRPAPPDVAKRIRMQNATLTYFWALLLSILNVRTHRRAIRSQARHVRVLICDRYILDSAAHVRFRYGPDRPFKLHIALVKLLSPRPTCAYFLDLPPEQAYRRKAEQYSPNDLRRLRALYLEEARNTKVTKLDATRAKDDLCAQVAQEVWTRVSK